MNIKVCGMRTAENIHALCQLPIQFIGFIFYSKSPRFVPEVPLVKIPTNIKKVGVFVNADLEYIEEKSKCFGLDYIQLHGEESVFYCNQLKEKGHQLIKAFAVEDAFDFEQIRPYEPFCDFFLLDTKGHSYGGNGVQFNWQILENYHSNTPFFLSGGITADSIKVIKNIKKSQLYGIDINSQFELKPALKDIQKISDFCQPF